MIEIDIGKLVFVVIAGGMAGAFIADAFTFLVGKAIAYFRNKARLRRIDKRVSEKYSWYGQEGGDGIDMKRIARQIREAILAAK